MIAIIAPLGIQEMKENTSNRKLEVIPKMEKYIQYMLEVIIKIPRTEKYSIGTEYKTSMYETIKYIMYLNKIEGNRCLYYTNHKYKLCMLERERDA